MNGLDIFGAENPDYVGFDYGVLFKTAGGLLEGGGNILEAQQAEGQSAADVQSKLEASIQADRLATEAAAKADVLAQLKHKNAGAAKTLADKAAAAADKAGANLPEELTQKRVAAAETMLAAVTKVAKANPADAVKIAAVKSWTATLNRIKSPGGSAQSKGSEQQESWLTRPVAGKIPGYGIIIGGLALVGVLGLVIKKVVSH